MARSSKIVFSKEKSTKPEDLLKFTIHEQLAMEPDQPEESDEEIEGTPKEKSMPPSSQREMEERFIHQLKAEKAKLKEGLQIDFARRSSIMATCAGGPTPPTPGCSATGRQSTRSSSRS